MNTCGGRERDGAFQKSTVHFSRKASQHGINKNQSNGGQNSIETTALLILDIFITDQIMAFIKSNKLAFILKFIALFPLSLTMIFVAMLCTGGGHGNYLPLFLVLGPASFLSYFSNELHPDIHGVFMIVGTAFLYQIYALLLHLVKIRVLPVILVAIHMTGVAILLYYSKGRSLATDPFSFTISLTASLALLAIIIWIFTSIRRRSLENQNTTLPPENV